VGSHQHCLTLRADLVLKHPEQHQLHALPSLLMANDEKQEREPTQLTQPKGKGKDGNPATPVEIPVPKVSTFRAAIRKVAQPVKRAK
jgi:hypothetical protein